MKSKILVFTLLFELLVGPAFSQEQAKKLTVDDIVHKANHMVFYQGLDAKGRVNLVITDKQGRTRNRVFNMLRRNDGQKDRDQKFFAFFQAPADVRKMVFMVHKHAALEEDDDRWLYMPSLDLVKRIAAGDKRTSFVGSDFLYEDISGRSPAQDTHELMRTTDKYYVIKNVPKKSDNVEFEYYNAFIDKKTFIPMRMEYFKKGNRLYRIIESQEVKHIQAMENAKKVVYPTVTLSVAKDLENKSETRMTRSNIRYNIGLGDTIFTERYLRRPPRDAMR